MSLEASVVIIVRNGAHTIRRQLDALARQVDAPPFEVLVVDNGSSDGTAAVVRQWIDQGIGAASYATVIDASERASIPYARNTGALAARGRVILRCDADDAVGPGWVRAFVDNVRSGGAGGRIVAWRPDGSQDASAFPNGLTPTEYFPHGGNCNMAVVREDFFAVGGYDESLPPYGCEDVDISWRLQEAGLPFIYVPDAIVDFSITPRGKVVKKTFRAAAARMAVAIRHPDSFKGRRLNPITVLGDVARTTVQLPFRMLKPGRTPRTRWLRNLVAAYGRAAGYWTYAVHKKPPRHIQEESR